MKWTKVGGPSIIDNLPSTQRRYTKSNLIFCTDNTSLLKTTPFLAFQTKQKLCKGPIFKFFPHSLPIKYPFQLNGVSQAQGRVHPQDTKKREEKCHITPCLYVMIQKMIHNLFTLLAPKTYIRKGISLFSAAGLQLRSCHKFLWKKRRDFFVAHNDTKHSS